MRYLCLAAALVAASWTPSAAAQGAFGVKPAQKIDSLSITRRGSADHLIYVAVPEPHHLFREYMVFATPEDGVCKVVGSGYLQRADQTGAQAGAVFRELHAAVSGKYGKATDQDFLRASSRLTRPEDYAESLRTKERTRQSFWSPATGATLPAGIRSIGLTIAGISGGSTFVMLSYEFDNFNACQQRVQKAKGNSGL